MGIIHYFNRTDDVAEAIDDKLSLETLTRCLLPHVVPKGSAFKQMKYL